jgi:hypothetical protein
MKTVKISAEYGIVIRKSAVTAKGISLQKVFAPRETSSPLDQNEELLSYGPHFGREAAEKFSDKLELLGLKYFEDFFLVEMDVPDWVGLEAFFVEKDS